MGKSKIHLHLLVLCLSGHRVIIYRASDNWQQFCRAPPVQDEFVFFNQIAAQYALAKCSQALSIIVRVTGKKYHVTPDEGRALRAE